MGGIDRLAVAALLRISAEQIEAKEINDVNLHIKDTHRRQTNEITGRSRDLRSRTVTITIVVPGSHGDAWYRASVGQPLLPPPAPPEPKRVAAMPWSCGSCGHLNGAGATACRFCGK